MWEILLTCFYIILFGFIILRARFFKNLGLPPKLFLGVFLLKIAFGTLLFLVYTIYYQDRETADIFKYFDDSLYMTQALWDKPADFFKMLFGIQNDTPYFNEAYYNKMNNWFRVYESSMYNDSHTIIRFNAVVRIFSFGFYHVHTVVMCFISLLGLTALYKAVFPFAKAKSKEFFAVIFLLPSALFWGSGVLKEGLLFFGFGFLILSMIRISKRKDMVYNTGLFLFSITLLLYLKFYVLAALSVGIFGYLLTAFTGTKKALLKYMVAFAIIAIAGLNIHHVFPGFNVLELLVTKQKDFIGLATYEESGSQFEMAPLEPTPSSFILNAPEALLNSFFRPFPQHADSPFMLMATVENVLVFIALGLLLCYFKKPDSPVTNLTYFFLFSGLILFLIVGWTTPVSGALVRYKIPGVMMLLLAGIFIYDRNRFKKLLVRIKLKKQKLNPLFDNLTEEIS